MKILIIVDDDNITITSSYINAVRNRMQLYLEFNNEIDRTLVINKILPLDLVNFTSILLDDLLYM